MKQEYLNKKLFCLQTLASEGIALELVSATRGGSGAGKENK